MLPLLAHDKLQLLGCVPRVAGLGVESYRLQAIALSRKRREQLWLAVHRPLAHFGSTSMDDE